MNFSNSVFIDILNDKKEKMLEDMHLKDDKQI